MSKSITEQDLFTRDAESVARDLLGKYVRYIGDKYLIVATEAYYHDESFCYGAGMTKEYAKKNRRVAAALFERPGTWCVYGGQLLLSVTDDERPDNVLIKQVKNETGELLGPDAMARALHLYKSKTDHCGCHGKYSLSRDAGLYIEDGEEAPAPILASKRVNIKDDKKLNFNIDV